MKIYDYEDMEILNLTNKYFTIIQLAMIVDDIYPFTLMIHRDEFHYGRFLKIVSNINKLMPQGFTCSIEDSRFVIDKTM